MSQIKYITNIKKEEVDNSITILCLNERGFPSILIKNSLEKQIVSPYSTDYLNIKANSVLIFEDKKYYFHIIESNKNDPYSTSQFEVIFDYLFEEIKKPISSNQLSVLISSLEAFFKVTPEKDLLKFQAGVYGELFSVKLMYESGYEDIINKYHDNFYTKHDIEINEKIRIEIKSTLKEKRIHNFSHNQIYRKDIDLYVFSIMLEESTEGYSLYDLFCTLLKYYNDPISVLHLHMLMKKCDVSKEKPGLSCSYDKAVMNFRIFDAKELPKIEMDEPNGVSNIKYDVDCSFAKNIEIDDFILLLK